MAKEIADTSADTGEIPMSILAYERLQELIVTLELKPGQMISEGQISDLLDLGRTPVRSAVQRLEQEGLLEIHRARGIMVPPIDIVKQLQLLDVRRQLEPYVSLRAAKNATPDQRELMRTLARQITDSAEHNAPLDFMRINRDVHAVKIRAANNGVLMSVMDHFYGLSMRFWYAHHASQASSLADAGALHAEILHAIADENEAAAPKKTLQLMNFLEKFTRATLLK